MRLKYISRPVQVIMVLVLLLCVFLFLQMFISVIVQGIAQSRQQPDQSKKVLTEVERRENLALHSQKKFTTEQKLHQIFTPRNQKVRSKENETVEVYDTDDDLLWEGKRRDMPYNYLQWSKYFRSSNRRESYSAKYLNERQEMGIEFSSALMIPVVDDDKRILQRWRYEVSGRYFTGLDCDGRKIGYAGSNGIKKSREEVEPFGRFVHMTAWCPEGSFSPEFMWMTRHKLYQINFGEERVETLFDLADSEADYLAMLNWRREESAGFRPVICVVTKDKKHHMLFQNPEQRLTLNLPGEWKRGFGFTATMDKIFIRHSGNDGKPMPEVKSYKQQVELMDKWLKEFYSRPLTRWEELYEVDSGGNLKLVNRFEWGRPAMPEKAANVQIGYMDWRERTRRYLATISPVIYWPAWQWCYRNQEKLRNPAGVITEIIREMIAYCVPATLWVSLVFSLLMVCAAFWHGWSRRTGWGRLGFWLVFVGVFNLAGLLTYLALNHTTVIRCGVCGKTRGLERTDCAGCKAELVMPKGRETDLILTGGAGSIAGALNFPDLSISQLLCYCSRRF